jgi:hypothetical protein
MIAMTATMTTMTTDNATRNTQHATYLQLNIILIRQTSDTYIKACLWRKKHMQTKYTEQDTERVRQEEQISAGLQTQRLGASFQAAPALPARNANNLPALALIAVGLIMLFGRIAPVGVDIAPGMVLLTIASCFLFFSFWRRIYGLLIPGSILAGLSIGVPFANLTDGVSVVWGLAIGFLSIFLIGRSLFNVRLPWPIIPAVILFGVGTIIAVGNLPGLFAGGLIWLPLMLIVIGLYLGWGRKP